MSAADRPAARVAPSAERRAASAKLPQPLFRRIVVRIAPNEDTRFLLLTALAGAFGGLISVALKWFIVKAQVLFFLGGTEDLLETARAAPPWLLVAAPAAAGLLGGLISLVAARSAGGGGVATIMEAVAIRHGVVRVTSTMWRAIASAVTIAGGGSVGREGPIVGLAAAMASRLGRVARLPERRLRIIVAAGAAAGFAAAYNTPIAGTLFVLEVIIGLFAVELIGPIALAAVIGTLVARAVPEAATPIYLAEHVKLESGYEMFGYLILGFAAAAAGALFLETLHWSETFFGKLRLPGPLKTTIGGVIVGAIAAAGLPEVLGNGQEPANEVLRNAILPLAFVFFAKIVATCATVGSGAPGGVYTPTLLLGASLGGAFGRGFEAIAPFPCAEPGAYALVGMGALLAATTRAPLLSVVFIYETSYDEAILLPLLLSCTIASLGASRLRPKSIYEEELERRGLSWEGTEEERALRAIRVRDIMRTNAPLLPPSLPVSEVVKAFLTTRVSALYIGDGEEKLQGAIDFQDAKAAINKPELEGVAVAADFAKPVPTLSPDASIVDANEALWRTEYEQLPVVDSDGKFLGLVTRRDLLGAIDREVLKRNVLLAKIRYRAEEGTVTDFFELPLGQRLEQVPLPESMQGRTLAECNLREKHGLNVLAVVRPHPDGSHERFSPHGSDILVPGDALVVIGTREAVEKFKALR